MKKSILIFILALAGLCVVVEAQAGRGLQELEQALLAETDAAGLSLINKEIGDYYVSKRDFKQASGYYIKALSSRKEFSTDERVQIAIYLSWAQRFRQAIKELKLVLKEDGDNVKARTHLARTLAWDGKHGKAIKQADRVLKQYPYEKDAMLIKANAMRWSGRSERAIRVYEEILERGEDFDARLGLSYALLAAEGVETARDNAGRLSPSNSDQQNEMDEVNGVIENAASRAETGTTTKTTERTAKSRLDSRFSDYRDTDDNRYNGICQV